MESFQPPPPKLDSIENAEIIFEGTSMKMMIDFCTKEQVTMPVGTPFGGTEITAAFDTAYKSNFADLSGFPEQHNLREAAAKILIREVTSFSELFILLTYITNIHSDSIGKISGGTLITQINHVRNNAAPLISLTKNFGIRDTVERLLRQNRK